MDQEKIGEFIKKLRQEKKLTQKELADKLGVTYQAVSKWENGKNIPDILILKKISSEFGCDMNELLNGEKNSKKKVLKKGYFLPILVLLIFLFIYFLFFSSHVKNFEFKTLSSSCDTFRISGSIAYNKEQSSIYISHVEYCGEQEEEVYKKITCTLYEANGEKISKISENVYDGEITLEDYLKNVQFYVDYSKSICREYLEGSLYIEIQGVNKEEKINIYKVPLTLKENCL